MLHRKIFLVFLFLIFNTYLCSKVIINVSGDKYVYLRCVLIPDRFSHINKFYLDLVPRKEDATNFKIDLVKLRDDKGNVIERTLFGSLGCCMLANITTLDNKYLMFYPRNDSSQEASLVNVNNLNVGLLEKIPANIKGYTWLVFHAYLLDQYFFHPIANDFLYLQRMQHKIINGNPCVDILPFSGHPESSGKNFVYWKIED